MEQKETNMIIPEILDLGFHIFRVSLKRCFLIVVCMLSVIFGLEFFGQSLHSITHLLSLFCVFFTFVLLGKSIHDCIEKKPAVLIKNLVFSLKKTIPCFFLFLLNHLLFTIGLVLLIIPGMYIHVSFLPSYALLIGEGQGVFQALNLSHKIVRGRWWKTCGLLYCSPFLVVPLLSIPVLIIGITIFFITSELLPIIVIYAHSDLTMFLAMVLFIPCISLIFQCLFSLYFAISHHLRKTYIALQ